MRALDAVCALLLGVLGALKVADGSWVTSWIVGGVTAAELVLAVAFLRGRRPGVSAGGMMLLGAGLVAWTLARGPRGVALTTCDCFGALRLPFLAHALVAAVVLGLGGLHSIVRTRTAATLDGRPAVP